MSSTPSSAPEPLHRHAFVWLDPSARDESASPQAARLLGDWLACDRPLIVRRPDASLPADEISLGLALPPDSTGKRRLSFTLPRTAIRRAALPPRFPVSSHGAVRPIETAARDASLELRCFGSHAWQQLTGLSYVTPASDVDLLLFVEQAVQWTRLRKALASGELPAGIDLEIVLRRDASFSWREYAMETGRVLFKDNTAVWLGTRTDIDGLISSA